jgi:hypothetical protein
LGGNEVQRIGVVALSQPSGDCTGVLLNWFTIITAAHCVPSVSPGTTDTLSLSAVYKLESGDFVCLTGEAVSVEEGFDPMCFTPHDFQVSVMSGFRLGDADEDLAVLVSDTAFSYVSWGDYAYIDVDTLSGVDRVELYGYGASTDQGAGTGVLRQGSVEVDGFYPGHFRTINRGARECHGDSGGPSTIYFDSTAPQLNVLGLMSGSDKREGGECSKRGGFGYSTRLSNKIPFIEGAMGRTCTPGTSAGRAVVDCSGI